ncbi:MAG: dinitrogenase iron-molybdenum cofactor biosynthesis protein [Negativicutes bacterium]|nr:dinitrogenase iron-molybdenum cofactor biosynthesis protein [Negativicutes bacterium]
MKIAIPVNEDKETVCISFGRTPLFLLVDAETGVKEYVDNSAAVSQGGAGIKAAQILVDNGVDVLLTPRCGENSATVLKAAEVSMYKTAGDSVDENLAAFKAGQLPKLNDIHPGFHNHGGK